MGREILLYVKALLAHWLALAVTGAAVTAALSVAPVILNFQVPRSAWVGVVLLAIPFAGFLAWRDEYRKVQALTKRIELRVSLHDETDDRGRTHHSLDVHNEGPGTAENVRLFLSEIKPLPRYSGYHGKFPQPLGFRVGDPVPSAVVQAAAGRNINEKQTERLPVAISSAGSDGQLYITGVGDFRGRSDGLLTHESTQMDLDERWDLRLLLSAANAAAKEIVVRVERDADCASMRIL